MEIDLYVAARVGGRGNAARVCNRNDNERGGLYRRVVRRNSIGVIPVWLRNVRVRCAWS